MGYYQIIPLCSGVWGILTYKIQRGVKWVTWSKLRLHCVMRSVKNKCQPFVFVQLSSQNTKQIWKYLSIQSHIWNTFFQRQIELGQHSSFITFDIFPSWREVWKNYNNVFFVPGGWLGLPPGLPGGHPGGGLQHQLLWCARSVNTGNIDDDVLFFLFSGQLEDLRLAEWSDHAPPPPSLPSGQSSSSSSRPMPDVPHTYQNMYSPPPGPPGAQHRAPPVRKSYSDSSEPIYCPGQYAVSIRANLIISRAFSLNYFITRQIYGAQLMDR